MRSREAVIESWKSKAGSGECRARRRKQNWGVSSSGCSLRLESVVSVARDDRMQDRNQDQKSGKTEVKIAMHAEVSPNLALSFLKDDCEGTVDGKAEQQNGMSPENSIHPPTRKLPSY